MRDDEKYISDLIADGEHQRQDFKFEITSSKKIARTLVAFANTDGGRLLIGVKDNGKIKGIISDEEFYMIDAAASMYCRPEVPFRGNRREAEGKTILEINVEPSEKRPHYAQDDRGKWMAYHRVRDNNFLADYILLQVWKREKRSSGTFIAYSENEKKVLEVLDLNESADFDTLKQETSLGKKALQNILINLVSLGALKMEFPEEKTIFLPDDPQQYI